MTVTVAPYQEWIVTHLQLKYGGLSAHMPQLFGDCVEVCEEMVAEFPELHVTGGAAVVSLEDVDRVYKPSHPWHEARLIHHTWCVDVEGRVVDPTRRQFHCLYGYITEVAMANDPHLAIALSAAVPLWIIELQCRPDLDKYLGERAPEIAALVAERADLLLFRGKKKGEAARIFNATAEGIALLAFVPGGVTIFGQHYEMPHPMIAPDNESVGVLRAAVEKE